jgi:hypothetical protein
VRQKAIALARLTSALKTLYGQETKAALVILRHWVRNNFDIETATPETSREIERRFLKLYLAAQPLERADAVELLDDYCEHFFKTATSEERAAFAIAIGYTPLEYEIMERGFSLRQLMQALKFLEGKYGPAPEAILTPLFERYVRQYTGQDDAIANMPQLIALYRGEPAMESEERARAIMGAFGVRLLDVNNPQDVQKWKELSGAREH